MAKKTIQPGSKNSFPGKTEEQHRHHLAQGLRSQKITFVQSAVTIPAIYKLEWINDS